MSTRLQESQPYDGLNKVKMNSDFHKKRHISHQPLSVFSKTSVGILSVHVLLLVSLAVFVRVPLVLVLAGVELLVATLILMGIRWMPVIGSLLGGFLLLAFSQASGYPIHHISHPKDAFGPGVLPGVSFLIFSIMTLMLWCGAMLIIVGIAATIHSYSQSKSLTPRWFTAALSGAVCLWLGAVVLGVLMQPDLVTAMNASGANTVQLNAGSFSQSHITISKGAKLTLIDTGTYHHNISDGTWIDGQPIFTAQPGQPLVKNQDLNAAGATLIIGPFNTAGSYHLMCSLHRGMVLTITVQ